MTYIFNKNLNQLFVYTMPYHYINSEVYAMLKHILVVVVFLVLLVHQMFDGICHMIHAAGKPGEFILMLVLNTHR